MRDRFPKPNRLARGAAQSMLAQGKDLSYLNPDIRAQQEARAKLIFLRLAASEAQVERCKALVTAYRQQATEAFPDEKHPIREAVFMVLDNLEGHMKLVRAEVFAAAGMVEQVEGEQNATDAG